MDKNSKKQVAKISVFITSLFVIFLSITYAFINMTLTGTKRQVITAGSLEIELEEENSITLTNAMPMYDEVGMIGEPFNFRLVNKSTETVNYIVALEDITDSTKEKLDTSIVKYGLTKDENITIDFLSSLTKNRIDRGKINGSQTIHYSLRLWIDSEVEDEELIKDKTLSYKITLTYSNGSDNTMKARKITEEYVGGGEVAWAPSLEDYYQYSNQITNIVLENKVNIPATISEDKKWDMSEAADKSVMAYIEEDGALESNEIAYKLHIQANGKIVANQDSGSLFYGFSNLTSIDGFENLDVSNASLNELYFDEGPYHAPINSLSVFGGCPKLNLDLSNLDVSNVTDMSNMFSDYIGESLTIGNWDTSNVTNMSSMFSRYSSSQSLDLSSFDTSNVTNMSGMFYGYSSSQALDLSHLDTSKVTDMSRMFSYYSGGLLTTGNWDTSNVTDMSEMFSGYSSSQPLDLSNLDTVKVTNMYSMFSSYSGGLLTTGNWDTSNVNYMSSMFSGYSSNQPLDLSSFDISKVTNMSSMFSSYSGGQLTIGNWVISNVTNISNMFSYYSSSQALDLSHLDTSNVTNMSSMFSSYSSSQSLDLSHLDTSKVTNMSSMFSSYSSSQALDLSHLDTSKVTNMSSMFSSYSSSQALDLSSLDTSKVTDMSSMFSSYSGGQLTIGNWVTSNVTNMSDMFSWYKSSQPLDLSKLNTSSVTNMSGMFYCSSITSLNLSYLDTRNVTNMSSMFSGCTSLTNIDLSSFDTSKVTDMTFIFKNIKANCLITVKDEATKSKILETRSDLTNVVVKSA